MTTAEHSDVLWQSVGALLELLIDITKIMTFIQARIIILPYCFNHIKYDIKKTKCGSSWKLTYMSLSLIIIKQYQNNKYLADMHKNKQKSTAFTPSSGKFVQSFSKIYSRSNKQTKNNANQKQIQSRITQNDSKPTGQYDINRLDLIFKSEPKEIQEKLLKLLISYNAVMQYNQQSDMFQVDLLLPFLNEDQKQEFIKQFLEIRRNRKKQTSQNSQLIQSNTKNQQDQNKQFNTPNKNNRKFSFGARQAGEQFIINQRQEDEMIDKLRYQQQRFDRVEGLYANDQNEHKDKTGQFKQFDENIDRDNNRESHKSLNFKAITQMFDRRLINAITIINKRKGKQQMNKENIQIKQSQKSVENDHQGLQNRQTQSIINQISMGTSLSHTQNLSDSKNMNSSSYNRDSIYEDQQNFHNKPNQNLRKSDQDSYDKIIQEKDEYEQYEPLFHNKIDINKSNLKSNQANKHKNITTFQDYTKKYTSVKSDRQKNKTKINYPKTFIKKYQNDKQINKNINNNYHRTIQRESPNKNNNNEGRNIVNSRDHSGQKNNQYPPVSRQYTRRQQHIDDFFKEHKLHLQNIYSEIRGSIKQRINEARSSSRVFASNQQIVPTVPEKSIEDLNILILDDSQQQEIIDNQQNSGAMTNKSFKQQMIKQYQKQILVTNQGLSSQDLTRYFKYLLANAKKLFLKYLKNKKK